MKIVSKGQYFMTLDDAELEKSGDPCREYTLPRDDKLSKVKGWNRGNTKIGPVLEVAVSYHQGRYGIEIMIESFFGDRTRSWVLIVNGIDKHVTEMTEGTQENRIDDIGDSTGKPVAEAGPKKTSRPTPSSPTIALPYHLREWIDIKPGKFYESCFEVSTKK